jgi:hypothetical protein
MSFRVNRAELLQILGRIQPGLSTRDFVEQSSCFVFDRGWSCTFNDEICCRTKTGFPDSLEGAVHSAQLMKVIENMTDDELDLDVKEGELLVQGKRKKAGIRMEAEIVLPVDQVESPSEWAVLPEDFKAAVEQVREAAGTNDEEFMTVCVHVHPDWLEACDRKQATRYTIKTGVSRSFLVRAKSLAHIETLDLTKIGETDNWLHFRNKSLIFSCRRYIEDYPMEKITEMLKFRGEPGVLPRGGVEAAKLAGVFSGEDKENDKVLVRLTDGHMVVRGEGAHGWAAADLEMAYHGPEVTFRIAPQLLTKLVNNHTNCEIGPGKLMVTGEKWKYLTVLGKADEPKKEKKQKVKAGD